MSRTFLYSILFSPLYFTVIYTLSSYISLDPDAHSCVAEIIHSMKPGTGNKPGDACVRGRDSALSLLLVFRFLFFRAARYFEAFSFHRTRFDNGKSWRYARTCRHDWKTSRRLAKESRSALYRLYFIYIRNRAPHIIAIIQGTCVCMQMDLCSRSRHLFRASKRLCREICAVPKCIFERKINFTPTFRPTKTRNGLSIHCSDQQRIGYIGCQLLSMHGYVRHGDRNT